MSRLRSAASGRSNTTDASSRTGRINRAIGTRGSKTATQTELEYPCNPCMRENNNVEATNYCDDCGENLCADCVKQHVKFQSMIDHKILGKSDRRRRDDCGSKPKVSPLDCSEHPGKRVDMFCADHNEVWCGACIAVNHRTCNNVVLIESAAKGAAKKEYNKEVKNNAREMKKKLVTLKKQTEKDISKIERQQKTLTNKIRDHRKRIDKVLDDLENATISELENACSRGRNQLEENSKMYGEMIASLDTITEILTPQKSTKDTDRDTTVFVGTKRAHEKIMEGGRILNFAQQTHVAEPIKYISDERIYDWLQSLQLLGTFSFHQEIYTGQYLERHDVSVTDEYKKCDMFGSTFLKDGRLMLTDWDNKKVKILDKSFTLIDQIVLLGHPDDVCSINPEEAAVTMTIEKTIQLISLVPKMNLSRIIHTDEPCRGITYHDGRMYVVCGGFKDEGTGKIVVYTVLGEHIKTIEKNNTGQNIFGCPIAIQVVSNGKFIYVSDGKRGIVTLTSNCDVVSVISYKEFAWPCGMCLDKNDNVLICNARGSNIIQVYGLNRIAVLLSNKDGVKRPHSISFDQDGLRVIMTSQKSKFITVFQLRRTSVKDVAMGTEVHFKAVEKQSKNDARDEIINVHSIVNVNESGNENIAENGNKDNKNKLTLPDIKEAKFERSTNTERTRNSAMSRRPSSDISTKEPADATTGKPKLSKESVIGSRRKSTSRETLSELSPQRSSSRATNQKRQDSAISSSRLSARSDKRETRVLNNTPRSGVTGKNSVV